MFQFKDCSISTNLTKAEIEEKLGALKHQAELFEEKAKAKKDSQEKNSKAIKDKVSKLWESYAKAETEIGYDAAYRLTEALHKEIGTHAQTKEDFVQEFAKLDFDGDEKVTKDELVNYELRQLYCQEILLIGICWIGYTVTDETPDPDKVTEKILPV